MHDSEPDDQIRAGMDGNQACLQCHSELGDDIQAHTHHAADSAGSQCYNCHMPRTSYALLGAIRSHRVDSPNVEASLKSGRPNACNLCHVDQSFAWTAGHIDEWYGRKTSADALAGQTETPAWVQWLLKGDAAQRVIAAANARFGDSRAASGDDWQAPLLAQLLTDDYPAIRFVAFHALREYPGFADLDYDLLKTAESRRALKDEVLQKWETISRTGRPALLQRADGKVDRDRIRALLEAQDRTPIQLIE